MARAIPADWHLRPAQADDCEVLWQWANDPQTRAMAYHPAPIPLEGHQRWFAARLNSAHTRIFVLEDGSGAKLGQVRFDEDAEQPGSFTIDINVAPTHRGQGVGRALLTLGEQSLAGERRVHRVYAEVKVENAASLALFRSTGYTTLGAVTGPGGQAAIAFEKLMNASSPSFPVIPLSCGKSIGAGRTFVIAEVASNHMCSLDVALDHIRAAAATGADAVKFQSIDLDELYHQPSGETRALHAKIDLPEEWHGPLKDACTQHGLVFLSSPTYLRAIDVQESVGVEIYKLASAQISVFPQLVRRVAELGKPVILSTGLVTEPEIERVVRIFREAGNDKFIVLHCNSVYPAPADIVHLPRMMEYQRRYGCRVGFSDHTQTPTGAIAAVAMGACVIERHFTLSCKLDSPDAAISTEPPEFTEYVKAIREAEIICQPSPRTGLEPAEAGFRSRIGHSLVAIRDIAVGELVNDQNTLLKRGNPNPGIGAWTVFEQTGSQKATRVIAAGEWLREGDAASA